MMMRGATSKRTSFSRAHISQEFLAAARPFAEASTIDNENNNNLENEQPAVNEKQPPASSRKSSFRNTLALFIPAGNNEHKKRSEDAGAHPPPIPKKVKMEDEVFETDFAAASEKLNKPSLIPKTGRVTLAPSEGISNFRGVFHKSSNFSSSATKPPKPSSSSSTDSPGNSASFAENDTTSSSASKNSSSSSNSNNSNRLVRQASSNGSDFGVSCMATRLAKTDVRFAELKNKLNDTQAQLSTANKRVEELEREVDRLVKENRELRRKLDAASRQQSTGGNGEEGEGFLVKVENLDKGVTSRVLLQMAESFGGEVTTARIMKAPTGLIHGYCSFANEKDAQKAMDLWKKMGLNAISVAGSSTSLEQPMSGNKKSTSASSSSTSTFGRRWRN